jgi:DNA invertase Pin-like site-specific DNA recombinase
MKNTIYGYVRISTMKQSIQRQIDNIKRLYPEAIIIPEEYTGTKMDRPNWNNLYKNLKEGDTVIFDEVSRMSRNSEEGIEVYEDLFDKGVNLIFIKEPHINTSVYRDKMNTQKEKINSTGSKATDKLLESIMNALHEYTIDLAKEQIRLAFEQAQAEVDYLHQRTKEGIKARKERNEELKVLYPESFKEHPDYSQIGRDTAQKVITHKAKPIQELIRKYSKDFEGHNTDEEVMGILAKKTVTVTSRDKKTGRTTTKEISAKLSRNTYYKYKAEMKAE